MSKSATPAAPAEKKSPAKSEAVLNKYSRHITQPKSQGASQAMLYATGLTEDDMHKAAGRHLPASGTKATPATCTSTGWPNGSRKGSSRPRWSACGSTPSGCQRRHLDGDRRDELFAPLARPDRRLDRNRDGRPVVRRRGRTSRLRQEHAGLPDRHGPAQSAGADGLWRHDQAGARRSRKARHRLGLSVLWAVHRRQDRRKAAAIDRPPQLPRRRGLRRHVHGQHHGLGDRGPGHVAPLQRLDSGRRSRQARRMPAGGGGDSPPARSATSSPATS